MKNLFLAAAFIFSLFLIGCSDKEKEEAELERMRQDSIRVADSVAQVQQNAEMEREKQERRMAMETGDTFGPEKADQTLEGKIAEGKVIILTSEGETMPFKIVGGKVMAVTMPDGKLYQVEKDGDKTILTVPGKGKMERREVDGKIYLVDNDDQMYEVKMMKGKLVAIVDEDNEVVLTKR